MSGFEIRDPDFARKVADSFARQKAMETLGGTIATVEPGKVILEMPFSPGFTQQHGFLHAGAITTMLDSAAGYAAFSLMPPNTEVLTIELKTSLMSPAQGEHFRFESRVEKAGRTITFCTAEAFAISNGSEKKIATLTATMMTVANPTRE